VDLREIAAALGSELQRCDTYVGQHAARAEGRAIESSSPLAYLALRHE
jgi:hypothetical protein